MHTVGRWGLRVPDGTDGPPNVPLWMDRLAVDLTDVAKDNQGTLAARPTSTVLSPGVSGRYFRVIGDPDPAQNGRLYRDYGTGWDEIVFASDARVQMRKDAAADATAVREAGRTGEAQPRWRQQAGGTMLWGAGAAAAPDTTLYRDGANTLRTSATFVADGNVMAAGKYVPRSIDNYTRMRSGQVSTTGTATLVTHGEATGPAILFLTAYAMGQTTSSPAGNYDLPNATQFRLYAAGAGWIFKWVGWWA